MWEDLEMYGNKRFVKVIFKAYILKSYIYSLTFGFKNTSWIKDSKKYALIFLMGFYNSMYYNLRF